MNLDVFPELQNFKGGDHQSIDLEICNSCTEIVHRANDWAVKISTSLKDEEVWLRMVTCYKWNCRISWNNILVGSDWFLELVNMLVWIPFDTERSLCVCPSLEVAQQLCDWGTGMAGFVEFEFHPWTQDAFAIRYRYLVKSQWICVWGLPRNLWTVDVFSSIGKICGGL